VLVGEGLVVAMFQAGLLGRMRLTLLVGVREAILDQMDLLVVGEAVAVLLLFVLVHQDQVIYLQVVQVVGPERITLIMMEKLQALMLEDMLL
jgi:hypothetical protein